MNESSFAVPVLSPVQVSAASEEVRNVLLSYWALTANDPVAKSVADPLAVAPWITQSATQLTPEQRHFNRLLFAVFGAALLPEEPYGKFVNYLAALALQPLALLQNRLVQAAQTAQSSPLQTEAAVLLTDPEALCQKINDHLRTLWDRLFAAEWHRHTFMLTGMTHSINELIFSQPHWQAVEACAALRFLLQTEPSEQQVVQLAGVRRIVLVWSPHLLAYCHRLGSGDTLWVMRTFDPQLMRRDPLSRAEVLRPLTALADETRLRILELLTEHGEQRAQEIIGQLEGSQGNISRHLKQLVGAGFVRERRAGDANKLYAINEAGIGRLLFLLRQLLSSHNAQSVGEQQQAETRLEQVRSNVPPNLRAFFDEQGRITRWSNKQKDQAAMMEHLAEKFEMEHPYSEKQVNELLQRWYLDADYAIVRRGLIEAGLLHRTMDGARYWR